MKIINSLDRRVLANQCIPVFRLLPCFVTTSTICHCQNSIGTRWMMVLCNYNAKLLSHTGVTQVLPTNTALILNSMCLLYIHMYIYTYVSIGQSAIIKSTSSSLDNSVQAAHYHIENTCLAGMNVLLKCFFSESPNKDFIVFCSSAVSGQLRWWLLQEDPV